MSDVADRVKKIVVEHLGVDESKVTENASFIDDLGADSLDTVELVMAFEEEFGCEIPDDAAEKIVTVKDAARRCDWHGARHPPRNRPRAELEQPYRRRIRDPRNPVFRGIGPAVKDS